MTTNGVGDAWIANELRILKREGIPFVLSSLTEPRQSYFHSDDIAEMAQATHVIYPISKLSAFLSFLAAPFRFRGRFFSALWNALTGPRESTRNRLVGIWHLMVACHWAVWLRTQDVSLIHSQWIHSAGTVAMYGAWLTGKPFSFTGHAADLFRERAALRDKIKRAEFIMCISEFHRQFYLKQGARPEQLHFAYCGLDLKLFSPQPRRSDTGKPFHILSSGRLVEKKGFDILIEACALLRERGFDFHCTIGGSGPLEDSLREKISGAGLEDQITLTGQAIAQEDIPAFMAQGDAYCLHCVWAQDKDVDGLPQMLMEAMACGLPVTSTRLVGIPDLVLHEKTGLLTDPGDVGGLADALMRLAEEPELSAAMVDAGHRHLNDKFNLDTCLDTLLDLYREKLERPK